MMAGAACDSALTAERSLKLMAIGTAAGLFSGLFGVGGGTVIVPLLVLWLGYGEREATGTSLAAIVFIAAFAAAVQAGYGNVHVLDGLLVGIPAVGGVLLGTWLQQRLQQPHDRAAVRGGAGRERGGAAAAMIGAIAIGLAGGGDRGPAGRRRRRAVRAGPRDLRRPRPSTRRRPPRCWRSSPWRWWARCAGPLRQRAPRRRAAAWALLSVAGAAGGVALANALSGKVLQVRLRAVHAVRGGAAGAPECEARGRGARAADAGTTRRRTVTRARPRQKALD